MGTHNNTISTSDSHHIRIRIDRDGSSDKKIGSVFLVDPEIDSASLEFTIDDFVRLLLVKSFEKQV